jgi:hypothetical protein
MTETLVETIPPPVPHAALPAHGGDAPDPTSPPAWRTVAQTPAPMARFYMTSDLRASTGLTRTHLDFYLREGLIRPTARTESGYLLFDDQELSTLRTIIHWRQDGAGIKQIRDRLGR